MVEVAGCVAARLLLLLLALSQAFPAAADGRPRRGFNISYPCRERVCLQVRDLGSRSFMVVVSNGRVQLPKSRDEISKCSAEVNDPEAAAGRLRCMEEEGGFTPHDDPQVLPAWVGRPVQLHCILLSFLELRSCRPTLNRLVDLTWVDEDGAEIRNDSQHQTRKRSSCHSLLTFTPLSRGSRRVRCQARVGQTLRTLRTTVVQEITVSARPRGRAPEGRIEPAAQAGRGSVVALAVGGVVCAALIGAATLFVMRRRRSRQSPGGPSHSHSPAATDALGADDVLYANIVTLPRGADRATVCEFDSTEYACIQYK